MQINYLCISFVLSVDIFIRSFDDSILIKFLIAVFLPAPPFIPTFPFINFGGFCQPPCLLRLPRLLFWPKFASLPVYSALPFYLKLESKYRAKWSSNISQTWDFYEFQVTSKLCCISVNTYCFPNILPIKPIEKDA